MSCPLPGEVKKECVPSIENIWSWIETMEDMGIRLTGSPAHTRYIDFLHDKLLRLGCVDVMRDPIEIGRWVPIRWSLERTDHRGSPIEAIPLAGYYPYSGLTDSSGEQGELVYRRLTSLADVEGKIVLMDAIIPDLTTGALALLARYIHEPDMAELLALVREDYRRPWLSLAAVVPDLTNLARRGAKGLVLMVDLPAEEAYGQYMPFTTGYGGLPAVLVDRDTGRTLKEELASDGAIHVRLVMEAFLERVPTYHLTGCLPGSSDSVIVLSSHTDGQNAVEENGPLGLVALGEYYSRIPRHCRRHTLCFSFVTGHFHAEVPDSEDWIHRHPEITGRMKAALCLEHLGTMQWLETSPGVYGPTGKYEPAAMFVSEHRDLVDAVIDSVTHQDLRRVVVIEGLSFGIGIGFIKNNFPMVGYLSGPTYLLNYVNGGIDKLDKERMRNEITTFIELVGRIDGIEDDLLR